MNDHSLLVTIPFLQFSPGWQVQIIPPYYGAATRFIVADKEKSVSVYLDTTDSLGCVGQPYWEAYNFIDEPKRFFMTDTAGLLSYIASCLETV